LLYLGLHARGQVGSLLQFPHAIVLDRHKDEARIFYRPVSALLDKLHHAQWPARQDHAWVGSAVMNRQCVYWIAILPFRARDESPIIRVNEP
jgi:hypothetical protein